MNEPKNNEEHPVRVQLLDIRVDCSKWVDTTTGDWTRGKFVVKPQIDADNRGNLRPDSQDNPQTN